MLRKMMVVIMVLAILVPVTAVAAHAFDFIGIGMWLFSFFMTRPQQIIMSEGVYQVPITVPEEYRPQLSGGLKGEPKIMFPKSEKTGDSHISGDTTRLIMGWKTHMDARFPTFCKEIKKIKWSLDNGMQTGELPTVGPYSVELPTNDENYHSMEISVEYQGGRASVICYYRAKSLAGYYAEYVANQNFASLVKNEFIKEVNKQQQEDAKVGVNESKTTLKIQLTANRNSLDPASSQITVKDSSGTVFTGIISGDKEIEVRPGMINIYTGSYGWASTDIGKDGQVIIQPGESKFVKIYKKEVR